jgi:hypothetical protein
MTSTVTNRIKAAALVALALAIAAMGIYVAEADDAPGAAGMGLLLMTGAIVLAVKAARNRLPVWAARTALAVGVVIATFAAILTHAVAVGVPLFAQPRDVPSVVDSALMPSALSPQYAAAVERARELVRAAILEQNLPGISAAVGVGSPSGTLAKEERIIWAEGFGWRDVETQTPVTPTTRFHIGTAASAITDDAVAPLRLSNTGVEPAVAWSPEQIGEPGEDFPPFAIIRHVIFQPLGLAPPEYPLPGDRATFYVPRSDDNPRRGRRLIYMRDLACCAGTLASYSTAPDLVRIGLASGASVNGELAGGMVMSLMTVREGGVAIAVLSNVTHANTSALALEIADVFAKL